MLISTQSLMAAARGNYEDIPEENRELVRLRLETQKRYMVKAEIKHAVRARQYLFYKDMVICSGMVRDGEEIFLLPSFRLLEGALADQLRELLPTTAASTETEDNEKLQEFDFARDVTLADYDSILKPFARAESLFYLSPSETDFSVFAKGRDSRDFLYAFMDNDRICLYLGKNEKLSISRCSSKTIFTLLLESLFRMHREEILAIKGEEA